MDQINRKSSAQTAVANGQSPKVQVVIKESKAQWVIAVVLAIGLVIALTFGIMGKMGNLGGGTLAGVEKDSYQALFLTNGQVYFGKLSQTDNKTIKITDIYYLQVQQAVQPKDDKAPKPEDQKISLAKLGKELHGPQDSMYIDRSQVVFYENLKGSKDSKVVEAIEAYKKSKQ